MRMKKGISLIVLVITIIVIILIASSVVISLSNNNPISKAGESKFKTNVAEYNSELLLALSNEYFKNHSFNSGKFNAQYWDGTEENIDKTIKEYITSITEEDALKFEIQNSKLVYIGDDLIEKEYITEMGLSNKVAAEINVIATQNSTVNGKVATYNNPIVPKGFRPLNTIDASWNNVGTDWNKGLVIEDENGNQFVWIPVNGTDVTFQKWCTSGIAWNDVSISDDTLPVGVTSETNQILDYGGFYIGRYEAGKEGASTLVSKQGATVWTSINSLNAKVAAEAMYTTPEVKSGLITGKQWDTTLEWIKDSGKDVSTNSSAWGNFNPSAWPADVPGYGIKQVSGFSEYWKSNNIYDLAGGVWEWTNEMYGATHSSRGGVHYAGGNIYPAAFRYNGYSISSVSVCLSFRVALYIL